MVDVAKMFENINLAILASDANFKVIYQDGNSGQDGNPKDHGTYADIPVDTIVAAWKKAYGENRVASWIAQFEKSGGISSRDFDREDIWKG